MAHDHEDGDGCATNQQWKLPPGETLTFAVKPVYLLRATGDTTKVVINMGVFDSEEAYKQACAELEANLREASENNRHLVSQAYVDARASELVRVDPDDPKATRGSN